MKFFFPTYFFPHAYDITVSFLTEHGYKAILSDLDDTLTCHDSQEISGEYVRWLSDLREGGIPLRILSNNSEERIRPFCDAHGLTYTCHARKPLKQGALRGASELGLSPREVLLLGDQVFTDILCGKAAGMDTAAVPPVGKKATRFIAFKRMLEKPIWRAYHRYRRKK